MLVERVEGWLGSHRGVVDGVGAGVLVGVSLGIGWAVRAPGAYYLFSVLLLGAVGVRRRWPGVCLGVVGVVGLAQWVVVRDTVGALPADVAVPIAVHAAAAYGAAWVARTGLVAGLVGAVLGGVAWPRLVDSVVAHLVIGGLFASIVVAAWAVGSLGRVRRGQAVAAVERAQLLEVERGQRDQLAVLAERARIAREMHDVVAHSLAVVIAQADGGRYASTHAADDPAMAALGTIGKHAREALSETRQILGVLRTDGGRPASPAAGVVGAGSERPASRARGVVGADGGRRVGPVPGVGELGGLIEQVRASGWTVVAEVEEPPYPVEAGLGLTVYRIVQEGLTNVMKHAGVGATAEVTVRWTAEGVEIAVADDGGGSQAGVGAEADTGAAAGAGAEVGARAGARAGVGVEVGAGVDGGHGLVGMRERVAVYGGSVGVRRQGAGGWLLMATVPVAGRSAGWRGWSEAGGGS
ncbi:sensor histidine kinase [Kribbella solani]